MTERFTLHIRWYNSNKTQGEAELKDNGQPILISEDIEDIRVVKDLLNELHNDKEHTINLIKEALTNEKTELGKRVLKQLLEAIQ